MKALLTALFVLALCGVAAAQSSNAPQNSSDLQVIGKRWKDGYSFRAYSGDDVIADKGAWSRTRRRSAERVNRGQLPDYIESIRSSTTFPMPTLTDQPWLKGYFYEATIKNVGAKKIKAVGWEYVFTDPLDQSAVTHHRFYTKSKISPGKEKNLVEFSRTPPTRIINAKAVDANPEHPYTEQLVIRRIEYADGSIWNAPADGQSEDAPAPR
jgi:hypothetical protein